MKRKKSRLRGAAFFLAICTSIFSACFCVLLMAGEYYSARYKVDAHNRELQGWEACRQLEPTYYKANSEAVSDCISSLEEARGNFWVKLPRAHLGGFFVLASLASATGGYLATWLVVWLGGLGIYRFFQWLVLCLRGKPKKQVNS